MMNDLFHCNCTVKKSAFLSSFGTKIGVHAVLPQPSIIGLLCALSKQALSSKAGILIHRYTNQNLT